LSKKVKAVGGMEAVIGLRLGGVLLDAVDAEVARRNKEKPWVPTTRADVIREAVYKLLLVVPAESATAP